MNSSVYEKRKLCKIYAYSIYCYSRPQLTSVGEGEVIAPQCVTFDALPRPLVHRWSTVSCSSCLVDPILARARALAKIS